MTKAKQKETAINRITRRIDNIQTAQDLQCLEYFDASISAMIFLSWRLEIITKEERENLEGLLCDKYFMIKHKLENTEKIAG